MDYPIAQIITGIVSCLASFGLGWLLSGWNWRRRFDGLERIWNQRLDLSQSALARSAGALAAARAEESLLQAQLDDSGKAIQQLERTLSQLEQTLRERELEADAAQIQLEECRQCEHEVQANAADLEAQVRKLQAQERRLEQRSAVDREQLAALRLRLGEIERCHHARRQAQEAQEQARQAQMQNAERRHHAVIRQKDAEIASLRNRRKAQVEQMTTWRRDLQAALGDKDQEIATIRYMHGRSKPDLRLVQGAAQQADDLTKISGIGEALANTLNRLGYSTYAALAELSGPEMERVARALGGFRGRIQRDDWVGQARVLYEQKYGRSA